MPANTKEIKRRIKSISSTLQVTKALEMISSVKMRKASQLTLQSREFSNGVWQLITQLRAGAGENLPDLFAPRGKATRRLIVLIASDKGLAGSYNSNVLRATSRYIKENDAETDVVTVGKKAAKIAGYNGSANIISSFDCDSEGFDFFAASPISKFILDSYLGGQYKSVAVSYTGFVNTLKQAATVKTILPIGASETSVSDSESDSVIPTEVEGSLSIQKDQDSTDKATDYKYEPDKMSILRTLGRLAVRSQIYQALLEASASEHAARMVAMKNATENGNELVGDLKFSFNKLRQQSITQEIAEISAGRIALVK